jgi:predicted DNA-binding protein with PD1-like motif
VVVLPLVKFSEGSKLTTRQSHSYKANESFTIFGSLSAGSDLMNGILMQCEKHNIKSGIVSCIGSLKEVGYVLFKTMNGMPLGYGSEINIKKPVELISGTGFICENESKELDLHFHGLVITEDGEMGAGHFLRGKNPTLITIEFSITASNNIEAVREFDANLGFKVINFSNH